MFNEYKTKVLSPIKPNSNESADLIIPEFVSNGLTQTIIDNSNIDYCWCVNCSCVKLSKQSVASTTK